MAQAIVLLRLNGEVVDLREGLRFSSLNVKARADLPDWLASRKR